MSVRLSIIQHHPVEGPGRLAAWASEQGIGLECFDATRGELPTSTGPVVLLGGPASTLDPPTWMQIEQAWLRDVLGTATPVLGICLGAQMVAIAAGGRVERMVQPETGWTPIAFDGADTLDALQWHEDRIVPPATARIEATSPACVQVYSLDPARVGMQFHPEWDDASLRTLHAGFAECPLPLPGDAARQAAVERWFAQRMSRWAKSW